MRFILKFKVLILVLIINIHLNAQSIDNELFNLPNVAFKSTKTKDGYKKCYTLKIKQPLDHTDLTKGYFFQKVYLSHIDFDAPMVMVTNGYSKKSNSITEVASMLNANQLSVEHRFFGNSMPDSTDYTFLTLEQVTADLHHIKLIFQELYKAKWVSTGISKGGQTTLIYRYVYPDDVSVSIPYVAPINNGLEDQRIYQFLDTVGTKECRDKLKEVQIRLLTDRDSIIPLMRWFTYGAQLNFNYINFEQALEYSILEMPFAFWQWGNDCEKIPSADEPIDSLLYFLVKVSGIDFFADKGMKAYASHYYQAGSQMGYYGYDISDFKGIIKALDTNKNPSAVFMPDHMQVEFNNDIIVKAKEWINSNGNQIVYINGNSDTWSATAIRPNKKVDALWFFLDGQDHKGARIKNFSEAEYEELKSTLERWLDLKIK